MVKHFKKTLQLLPGITKGAEVLRKYRCHQGQNIGMSCQKKGGG